MYNSLNKTNTLGNQQYKTWEIAGRKIVFTLFYPFIWLSDKLNISPNAITTIGLLVNILAAIVFIAGAELSERGELTYVGWAGFCILIGGFFDMLDGYIAKHRGKMSTFGALYDSVLDRYSELFMFLGIMYYLVSHHYFYSSVAAFLALTGSVMVSYTRARAEGLNISCSVGFMQRPVRILMIGFSAMFAGIFPLFIGIENFLTIQDMTIKVETISIMIVPIWIVAVLSNYTAIQRLHHCYKVLQENN